MRVKPPIVALLCLVVAIGVHWLTPSLRFAFPGQQVVGVGVALAGLATVVFAFRQFATRETTVEPFGTPTALVTSGPYRFTRNPMYLSMLLILIGIAVFVGSVPLLLAPAAFFAIINASQIPSEERRLLGLFGDEYANYRRRVRRWL